ncbi:hypothetical protein EWM64_g3669 [Hericium alpestre]|uniref:Uncharacterized protein n=1 Tax=Hericium alpestre TaxID=135208 RepID=A0A4Z0A1X9_9AGAM|nr:hypothetical protein EWM64_g3669 [Hericium alpestre]
MSSEPNSPTNLEPPPPAYEASQPGLDQKVSRAIQRSLAESSPVVDENGWPIYDATAFEATAASYERLGTGSSVTPDGHVQDIYKGAGDVKLSISTSGITPLRIRKRGRQREDASQDAASGQRTQRTAVDRSISPPPALTPTTRSSWDGPSFENVVRLTPHPDSRPSSPLSSPPTNATALPERSLSPQSRQSRLPPPARRRSPRRSYAGQPLLTSRLDFDPSQAYKHSSDQADMQAPTTYDATAFYKRYAYTLTAGKQINTIQHFPIPFAPPIHVCFVVAGYIVI